MDLFQNFSSVQYKLQSKDVPSIKAGEGIKYHLLSLWWHQGGVKTSEEDVVFIAVIPTPFIHLQMNFFKIILPKIVSQLTASSLKRS